MNTIIIIIISIILDIMSIITVMLNINNLDLSITQHLLPEIRTKNTNKSHIFNTVEWWQWTIIMMNIWKAFNILPYAYRHSDRKLAAIIQCNFIAILLNEIFNNSPSNEGMIEKIIPMKWRTRNRKLQIKWIQ